MKRRLYLFPALLPLVEIVPWLLTALGAVAGLAGFSFGAFWGKHRGGILAFGLLCFIAAGATVAANRPDKVVREEGSQLIAESQLPKAVMLSNDVPSVAEDNRAKKFDEVRKQRVKKQILATPLMVDGMLLIATYKGTVEAYDPQNGAALWSVALKEPILAFTADKNGIVYAGEGLHTAKVSGLTAIRATDGKVLWRREFLGHVEEPPAVLPEEGLVVTGSGPASIWALDIDDGDVEWHTDIGHMDSRSLVYDGVVYAHAKKDEDNAQGFFHALDADDGEVLWQIPLPGQPWGEPVLHKDRKTILTTSGIGQIGLNKETDAGWAHAISVDDKKIIWTKELQNMPLQPGLYIAEQDIIIETLKNGGLVALNAKDGSVVWNATVGASIQSVATLIMHLKVPLVAVTSFDGVFSILRASDGVELARRMVPKGTTSSPLVTGDKVYVATPYDITVFSGLVALAETP